MTFCSTWFQFTSIKRITPVKYGRSLVQNLSRIRFCRIWTREIWKQLCKPNNSISRLRVTPPFLSKLSGSFLFSSKNQLSNVVPSAYPPEAMWHHQDALNWILMSLVINAWWRAKTVTSWMTSNTELLPVANLAGGRETWARATVSIGNLVLLDIFSQLPFYSQLFQNWALFKWERGLKFFRCNCCISVTEMEFSISLRFTAHLAN